MNQPFERKAQLVGNEIYKTKARQNPDWDYDEKKKARGQSLVTARRRIGARKVTIDVTPREWEAIQMGAVSTTRLQTILRNTDPEVIRAYATPRASTILSAPQQKRAITLLKAGYSPAEIAKAVGVPVKSINNLDRG
jgi:DNA-directed RNA polymerase specialized sigma24 family protein